MPVITTQKAGINASEADPKPATAFDYAGQPIKPGNFYNGRPEHMGPSRAQADPEHPKKRVVSPSYRLRLAENLAKARAAQKARKLARQAQGT